MYKTYAGFTKYYKPQNNGEGLKYPCVGILYFDVDNRIEKIIGGRPEDHQKEIDEFVDKMSKKNKKSYSLRIIFFEGKGKNEVIHQSGEFY